MEFASYIKRKKENHEEGDSMTAEQLMLLADSKYKLLLECDEGWGIANPQEEKILALEAKIAKIGKFNKRKANGTSSDYQKKGKGDGKGPAPDKPAFMDQAPPKGRYEKSV